MTDRREIRRQLKVKFPGFPTEWQKVLEEEYALMEKASSTTVAGICQALRAHSGRDCALCAGAMGTGLCKISWAEFDETIDRHTRFEHLLDWLKPRLADFPIES